MPKIFTIVEISDAMAWRDGNYCFSNYYFSRLFGGEFRFCKLKCQAGITRLKPQMAQTARLLWTLYFLNLTEILLLYFAGLPFTIQYAILFYCLQVVFHLRFNRSYDSAYVDMIVTFFMLISGINFVILYYIFNHIKDNSKSIHPF